MNIGDKVPVVLEIVRPVEHGEPYRDINGNTIELINLRCDKFWAAPVGSKEPLILVCFDSDSPTHALQREAIVSLIMSGVGA